MPSASQIAANQANAQLSTGPRTPAGKSRSSQNSRSHGLTAKNLRVDHADQPAFDSLTSALREELTPEGELELSLFDRIVHAHWNLRKLTAFEADLLASFDPFNSDHSVTLNRLSLYRSRTESSLYKAQNQLRAIQEERHLRDTSLDNPSAFSPIVRIASVQKNWTVLNRRVKRSQAPSDSPTIPSPDFSCDQ
jgi:hypothetical protein